MALFVITMLETEGQTLSEFQPKILWGGRSVAVTVDPTDARKALVATESGGLFMTLDQGQHWNHVSSLPMFRLIDVLFAPVSPQGQKVVIATGWSDSHADEKGTLWRSTDGGLTWRRPDLKGIGCGTSRRLNGYGIAFEPGSQNVFVGTDCGLMVSRDLGVTWSITAHVNVLDGEGWSRVLSVSAQRNGIVDIYGDAGFQRSTTAGSHFGPTTPAAPGGWVHALTTSPLEPSTVYLSTTAELPPPGCADRATTVLEGQVLPNGQAVWSQVYLGACLGGLGRAPWIAAHPSRDGNATHFDLYFGTGFEVWRQTVRRFGGAGTRASAFEWNRLVVDHPDQNGIAFGPADNCPMYIVSDGGVHRPLAAANALDCGGLWQMAGNGTNGFNALQIYEVTGQIHPGDHTDLYLGTQDNGLWASGDFGATWPHRVDGEGYRIQVPRYSTFHDREVVTHINAGAGVSTRSDAHFENRSSWNNPPGEVADAPTLIAPGVYVQYSRSSGQPANRDMLNLTRDFGATWTPLITLPYERRGFLQVSSEGGNLFLYQGILKPGIIGGDEVIGLVRVVGLTITGAVVGGITIESADNGLASIGLYCMGEGSFQCPPVFSVDPRNPGHLYAVDVGFQRMMQTTNGGALWTPDEALTSSVIGRDPVTAIANFAFSISIEDYPFNTLYGYPRPPGSTLQVHAIAFDPFRQNHILVGTEAAGILESVDGGTHWNLFPNSVGIPGITSFYFYENSSIDPVDTVIVSSYGRGLWKMRLPLNSWQPFGSLTLIPDLIKGDWIRAPRISDIIDVRQFLDPKFCPACVYDLVYKGRILGSKLNSLGHPGGFLIDGGEWLESTPDGVQVTPSVGISALQTQGDLQGCPDCVIGVFEGCPSCEALSKQGLSIVGLIRDDKEIKAIIAGAKEPPHQNDLLAWKSIIPLQQQHPAPINWNGPYLGIVQDTEGLVALGEGFCVDAKCSTVRIRIGDRILADKIAVDPKGRFEARFSADLPRGFYRVTATQVLSNGKLLEETSTLQIVSQESEAEDGLTIEPSVTIRWEGGGVLQFSDSIDGKWTNVPGAKSPYSAGAAEFHRFYRVMH